MSWTESTAAPGNIFNSPMRDLCKLNWQLRYWQEHDNLYIWAPIPIYTDRSDYRSLEMALIQEWQPRLNDPFICQFFHPRRVFSKNPFLTPMRNLVLRLFGGVPNTSSLHNWYVTF